MDFFKDAVCYDPVNYYLLLEKKDLLTLKSKLTQEQAKQFEEKLKGIHKSYREEKLSVIYKKHPLPGMDKKDYVSLATYYWPNPNTEDGLPYISKDGEANPLGKEYDKDKLRELAFITYYQALLYYLTDNPAYYSALKDNVQYFLLDEETGMNPNLEHAQMILGKNLGRGIGIIDFTANFTYPLRLIKLLYDMGYIEEEFYQRLAEWVRALALWMESSAHGLEEKYARNNHGIFYDLGLACIYDYLNEPQRLAPLVYQMIEYRLSEQIQPDGSMPVENNRTKSKNYSLMAVKGIYDFNTIVKEYGFDLYQIRNWYYRSVDFDLKEALQFIFLRLVQKKIPWNFKQIIPFDEATLLPLIIESKKQLFSIDDDIITQFHMVCDLLTLFL